MALTSNELARIDEALDALAAARAIPADALERVRAHLAEVPLGDLARVDGDLDALGAGLALPASAPPAPAVVAAAPIPAPEPAAVEEEPGGAARSGEATHSTGDRELLHDDRAEDDEVDANEPRGEGAPLHREPARSEAPAPIPAGVEAAAGEGDDFLNPFDEPEEGGAAAARVAGASDEDEEDGDEATMVLDMKALGGLDESALFDGFVEEATSAPLEGGGFGAEAPALAHRPSSIPPPIPAAALTARGADERPTDIEDLKSYLEGDEDEPDLELFVDEDELDVEAFETAEAPAGAEASEDADGDAPKKKGFFKKLFG
jgi:hypothetical protein